MTKIILSANTDWYLYNFRLALANYLRGLDFDVVFVSPSGMYSSHFERFGFRWIQWEVNRNQVNPLKESGVLLSLSKIYRQEKPDIVHHHTIKPVIYGSFVARMAKIPAVVNSITGRGYVFQSEKIKARLLRWIIKYLYRKALRFPNSKVIFENQFDRQDFINAGFVEATNSYLIEGVGVDPERFFPVPEPDSKPLVLFSGRMLWDKGVDVFVEAAKILKSKLLKARFVLVGKPDPGNPESIDEGILKKWSEDGLIEWWGWQSDMVTVFAQTHIVVLPTRYGEGVPTILIEGAACGKPLIAADVPGCRSIVQNGINGILLPENDPISLANAMEKLIFSQELRKEMGKRSRELFLSKFTQKHINLATMEVYKDVAGKLHV